MPPSDDDGGDVLLGQQRPVAREQAVGVRSQDPLARPDQQECGLGRGQRGATKKDNRAARFASVAASGCTLRALGPSEIDLGSNAGHDGPQEGPGDWL